MWIDPKNKAIMALDDRHPAKRFLLIHKKFCDECVGLEIQWPNGPEPIEQEFHSEAQNRKWRLSGILYAYFSLQPIMDHWGSDLPPRSPNEMHLLGRLEECRILLAECKLAAQTEDNQPALEIIKRAFDTLDSWVESIVRRWDQ